jgi:ATP-dependent exoDNAse (exonuclease V) beta subunit
MAVITATGSHVLVDAGAGSGKTSTVVLALCHQLGVPLEWDGERLDGIAEPLPLEKIAAITFTNQAAADLKRKMRAALRDAGNRALASEVDTARIGTIHGFCGDLIRDFALRSGVRPAGRVLEQGETNALVIECAREALVNAIGASDVPGLPDLLTGRKLKDVTAWVARAAEDTGRISVWNEGRESLRAHEQALLTLAQRTAEGRQKRLEEEGLLDFDRMIVAVRDLLHDDGIRHAVQRRVRLLVLDEFQDVDPAQRDIAFLLGGITHTDPSPTRLILVGDPKQSIYRFRRADVTLWNEVAGVFKEGAGAVLPLVENFRSKAAILGLVDAAIGPELNRPVADDGERRPFEVDYSPLVARAEGNEGDGAVEFITIPAGEDGKPLSSEKVREIEARAVARRITELKAEGTSYGSIALLLAGWADVAKYETALRDAGIPAYVIRSEGFWKTREALDCLLALRVIRDPSDDIALVGFLKSPFVGVRDDTLLALARLSEGKHLADALWKLELERPLIEKARAILAKFGALRDRISIHELVRRLLDETGYLAVLALDPDRGPQAIVNVRELIRVAAGVPDQSLGDFLKSVAEARDREDRVEQERLYHERADVVTISSIHSAKGLEWPVVFWCDTVREVKAETDRVLFGRERFAIRDESIDDEGKAADPVHAAVKEQLQMEQRAEAHRLWYVASTRAKTRLILSGIPLVARNSKGVSPARMLMERFPALATATSIAYTARDGTEYHATVRQLAPLDVVPSAESDSEAPLSLAPERIRVRHGLSMSSATKMMAFAHPDDDWSGEYEASGEWYGVSAIDTGTIVHALLERFTDERELDALIDGVLAEHAGVLPVLDPVAGAKYRAQLAGLIRAATGSDLWKRFHGAGARREIAFTRLLPGGSFVMGAIDVAARFGDGIEIADFKTTGHDAATLAKRYEVQAAVYTEAVRAIAGVERASFTLLAMPAGAAVGISPTTDVAELIQRMREAS